MINYDLPQPIKGFVLEKFLYDLDVTKVGMVPARVIGFSSYPGDALALTVLLDDGSLFAYLPLDAFVTKQGTELYSYQDLVYHNCASGTVAVSVLSNLAGEVQVFLKGPGDWLKGTYVASLDWYEGNDLLHLILLENGQLAAMPNHKVKFGAKAPQSFTPYKKLHQTWKVD